MLFIWWKQEEIAIDCECCDPCYGQHYDEYFSCPTHFKQLLFYLLFTNLYIKNK